MSTRRESPGAYSDPPFFIIKKIADPESHLQCCSKNDRAPVPIDLGLGPLRPYHRVDGYGVFFLNAAIQASLATLLVLSWLHCENDVISLPRQLIVIDQIEWARVWRDLRACQPYVRREQDAVMAL